MCRLAGHNSDFTRRSPESGGSWAPLTLVYLFGQDTKDASFALHPQDGPIGYGDAVNRWQADVVGNGVFDEDVAGWQIESGASWIGSDGHRQPGALQLETGGTAFRLSGFDFATQEVTLPPDIRQFQNSH